jgi:Holliday junction DNA helicase RuvB
MDRKIIEIMVNSFSGGPVGIESLAASLGEDKDTIEDVYEPFLIQKGYVRRTPRGRQVCTKGYKAVNLEPQGKQMDIYDEE